MVGLVLLWGLTTCALPTVVQTRLVRIDPRVAPVTLSLNSSATYLGISMGAALGSVAVAHGGVLSLGFLAGGCELLGLFALRGAPEMASGGGEAAPLERPLATVE